MANTYRLAPRLPAAASRSMLLLTSAVLLVALPTGPARAQAPIDGTVGEVVVTARKRDERLRDIPAAGTAIGAEQIERLGGMANVQSLLSNVPGVNFADTNLALTSEVSIRGSSTSRNTSAEAAVGLFRNGVYIGGGQVGGRSISRTDFFDVSRVEVLRGVQGALNGRNAVGGSINVISARPNQTAGGSIKGEIANNDRLETQLIVNQPLNEHFAVRLGVDLMEQKKGFYYNPLRDEYPDSQSTEIYRAQLGYENGPFTANLMVEHGLDRLPGLVYQLNVPPPNATYPRGVASDKYLMIFNGPSSAKQQVNNVEFTWDYDLDFASLTSTSAVRERRSKNGYDRDIGSPQFQAMIRAAGFVAPGAVLSDPNLEGYTSDYARILYQDVHLVGAKEGKLSWLVGAEMFDLNDKYLNTLSKSSTPASRSFGTTGVSRLDFLSLAAYGSLGYDITEALNLTGELRYTKDDKHLNSNQFDFGTGLPTGVGFAIDRDLESDNLSYNVTLAYKMGYWLTYAKVGTAYRAGGFNLALGDPRQPVPIPAGFNDEKTRAYEVGAKGNITPKIYVSTAAYFAEVSDVLVQTNNGCFVGLPQCPVQATPFAFNSGNAELWGVEAEVTTQVDVGGGVMRVTVGGARQGGEIVSGPDKGRHGPQRPDWTGNVSVNYTHDLPYDLEGFVNLKGSGRWGGVQEIAQTPKLPDYQLFDIRAGVTRDNWELAGYVNNFANESYVVFVTATSRRFNNPQTYGASLRYKW